MSITLPRFDKRTAIIGSTGSGKTQLAFWLASVRHDPARPFYIFDFKGESLIEELEYLGAQEISIYGNLPSKPGIYILRPIPERDDKAVAEFLWKIWAKGNALVWIDEGYMLGARNPALNACLTQGRSKGIEMMILSQRPVWISKFVFSEANFFAVMNLTLEDDRKFVSGYVGGNKIQLLPKYHAYWYNADDQTGAILAPVPGRDELLERFAAKMLKRRKVI